MIFFNSCLIKINLLHKIKYLIIISVLTKKIYLFVNKIAYHLKKRDVNMPFMLKVKINKYFVNVKPKIY
jgi:hypothetical protein